MVPDTVRQRYPLGTTAIHVDPTRIDADEQQVRIVAYDGDNLQVRRLMDGRQFSVAPDTLTSLAARMEQRGFDDSPSATRTQVLQFFMRKVAGHGLTAEEVAQLRRMPEVRGSFVDGMLGSSGIRPGDKVRFADNTAPSGFGTGTAEAIGLRHGRLFARVGRSGHGHVCDMSLVGHDGQSVGDLAEKYRYTSVAWRDAIGHTHEGLVAGIGQGTGRNETVFAVAEDGDPRHMRYVVTDRDAPMSVLRPAPISVVVDAEKPGEVSGTYAISPDNPRYGRESRSLSSLIKRCVEGGAPSTEIESACKRLPILRTFTEGLAEHSKHFRPALAGASPWEPAVKVGQKMRGRLPIPGDPVIGKVDGRIVVGTVRTRFGDAVEGRANVMVSGFSFSDSATTRAAATQFFEKLPIHSLERLDQAAYRRVMAQDGIEGLATADLRIRSKAKEPGERHLKPETVQGHLPKGVHHPRKVNTYEL